MDLIPMAASLMWGLIILVTALLKNKQNLRIFNKLRY